MSAARDHRRPPARVLFADTRGGVLLAADILAGCAAGEVELVVLSAEALVAANACGLPHRAIGELLACGRLADQRVAFRAWLEVLRDFEERLAAELPDCAFDGPGVMLSRAYLIAFAVNSVRNRAGLMIDATRLLGPQRVTVIESAIDATFASDGYEANPWSIAYRDWASAQGIGVEFEHVPQVHTARSLRELAIGWVRRQPILRALKRRVVEARTQVVKLDPPVVPGLRLLFCDASDYDWRPVQRALGVTAEMSFTVSDPAAPRLEDARFAPRLEAPRGRLRLAEPPARAGERERIGAIFDAWCGQDDWAARLTFAAVDTFTALRAYLRALAQSGPALLRQADAAAATMLDALHPEAVCFTVVAYPHQKRLSFACAQRAIPVFCYQHGGAYGTHDVPVHDFIEGSDADFFLTYGGDIAPPMEPLLPLRAQYVPVGSTRLEALRAARRIRARDTGGVLRVVFAGDVSFRNTLTAGTEIEDTQRHLLERMVLETLGGSSAVRVVYRPFPGDLAVQGTPAWLDRHPRPNLRVDARTGTAALIEGADLLITLSTSGTLWNEALALGVPLVAYADARYTELRAEFRRELADTCVMCGSEAELAAAVVAVASEGRDYLRNFARRDAHRFLERYVLAQGGCVEAAVRSLGARRLPVPASRCA